MHAVLDPAAHHRRPFLNSFYYSAPDRGAPSTAMSVSVCLRLCLSAIISRHYTSDLHQIFVHVTYGRRSVFFWRRSDKLSISGFADDVIFAHKLLDVAARLSQ